MENKGASTNLEISKFTSIDNSVTTVTIVGELDLALSHRLQNFLLLQIASMSKDQELYVNLGSVDYISSTGVGAFSTALVTANKNQVKFYIYNLKPKVRSVFSILGLTSYFTEKIPDATKC